MTAAESALRFRQQMACAVVVLASLVIYLNALPNGLHVDDQQQIVDNPWIKSPEHLREIFTSGVWDHAGRVSSYYRPMMYVLYMATYLLFGLQPWAFHLVNILFHLGSTLLVFLIAWDVIDRRQDGDNDPLIPAVIAGLLFATHPIHTEAVAWAAGIADLSYASFYLLALYLYIRWASRSLWGLAASAVAFFLALLCKEPAFTLPVLLLIGDWILKRERFSWRRSGLRLLPFAAAAGLYLGMRFQALGGLAPVASETGFNSYFYAINVLHLFSRYLEALVLPISLNFWHVFEPITSLWSMVGLRSLLVLAAFVGAGWWSWRRSPLALLGWFLILLPLLPSFHVSALNQGLENAFAERYLYLPSAGYVLFIAGSIAWLQAKRSVWMRPVLILVTLAVIGFCTGTILRNPIWRTSLSLWSDTVSKSPTSAVVQMNYGFALIGVGRIEEGREHLHLAAEIDPGRVDLKVQNALAYASRGNDKQAILELSAALELDPESVQAHYNIAVLYERLGWSEQAERHYRVAIDLEPGFGAAHNNLGILLAEREDLVQARRHFEAAVRSDPENFEYRANMERLRQLSPR